MNESNTCELIEYYKSNEYYNDKQKEMIEYNNEHIKVKNNVSFCFKTNNVIDTQTLLIDNLNRDKMEKILLKCLSDNQIKSLLLQYELQNKCEKNECINDISSIDNFIKQSQVILKRYQHKAGGYLLEDTDWEVHTDMSSKHDLSSNEVWFVNSASKPSVQNKETIRYIKSIVSLLNNICKNIDVSNTFIESKSNNIIWTVIKCKDNCENNNIGL